MEYPESVFRIVKTVFAGRILRIIRERPIQIKKPIRLDGLFYLSR
jgi:hypothetical protein